jgi:phosphoribosyl 1,2-cyclic phosphodiesterase
LNFIKFLGTAGARIVVSKQLRSSGGVWFNLDQTNILVDPGPGCLVKCWKSKPKLNPRDLDAIILSHKHLDHANDVNIMIEAMTEGGLKPKGILFAPADALDHEPVVFNYVKSYLERVVVLKEKKSYQIKSLNFFTGPQHHHGQVETFGFKFKTNEKTIAYITDTYFFPELLSTYQAEILIINLVLLTSSPRLNHLCVKDVEKIIQTTKPELVILTHFGMTMLKAKPWEVAEQLKEKFQIEVIAASDGMKYEF